MLFRSQEQMKKFKHRGISVHSKEEAIQAQQLGATYLIAGHIYQTQSKPGIPPKGLDYLEEIVQAVEIPVYAIGGVTKERLPEVLTRGAKGAAMMSWWI